ncbi:FISUMP domain-containing protein [Rufibacter psychrotolerans]|uniref:FISUMP domain-containing protein n=1 Tax=Rufibacter psychrotolerans TaxID=2812556 RepID=UPI0019682C23|nr:FISUMP domain-containing protein [Rufibacter sp. SYSU D00308]
MTKARKSPLRKGALYLKVMVVAALFGCDKDEAESLHGHFTDARDGKTYKTVQIGAQVWMAENLNYEAPGSLVYDNDSANAAVYGRLYNWETACKVCPPDWHLPSKQEWDVLVNHLGGDLLDKEEFVGRYLKEEGTTHWEEPNTRASNSSGFTGLPGGSSEPVANYHNFISKGFLGHFWSSTEYRDWLAWSATLFYNGERISIFTPGKSSGFSVRCLKNQR